IANTRSNACVPSLKASVSTPITGSAKNITSSSTAGKTSVANPREFMPLAAPRCRSPRERSAPAGCGRPAGVDLRLARSGLDHIERPDLRRGRKLVGHGLGQLHAGHAGPHEALREDSLPE